MNRRILIVDDQEPIHEAFRDLLGPDAGQPRYELAFAHQGRAGVLEVQHARQQGRPFAVAFVDVRMPPGWDGAETIGRMAAEDSDLQFVAMTAFADRNRRQLIEAAGDPSRLLFVKKPFAAEEIEQLAVALTERWNQRRVEVRREAVLAEALDLARVAASMDDSGLEYVADTLLNSVVSLSEAGAGALLRDGQVWRATAAFDAEVAADIPAAGSEFTRHGDYVAIRLSGNVVLILQQPALLDDFADLLHLAVSMFGQILLSAFAHEKRLAFERDAAIGRAVSDVAHDLKGRIHSVEGFAELLPTVDDDHRDFCAQRISTIMRQMREYLDELLDFTHAHRKLRIAWADLAEMAADIASDYPAELISISSPPRVDAPVDRAKLERAVRNVVANAVDKAAVEGYGFQVSISIKELDECIEICVEDNGAQVNAAVRQDLFQPLVSHGKTAGTGLGLAIARDYVTRHNGRLELVESRHGFNCFRVTLPRTTNVEASDETAGASSS